MSVIILILKIIGIALLAVLGILLLAIALVLFVPIRYEAGARLPRGEEGEKGQAGAAKGPPPSGHGKVSWLFSLVAFRAEYLDGEFSTSLRVCGIPVRGKKGGELDDGGGESGAAEEQPGAKPQGPAGGAGEKPPEKGQEHLGGNPPLGERPEGELVSLGGNPPLEEKPKGELVSPGGNPPDVAAARAVTDEEQGHPGGRLEGEDASVSEAGPPGGNPPDEVAARAVTDEASEHPGGRLEGEDASAEKPPDGKKRGARGKGADRKGSGAKVESARNESAKGAKDALFKKLGALSKKVRALLKKIASIPNKARAAVHSAKKGIRKARRSAYKGKAKLSEIRRQIEDEENREAVRKIICELGYLLRHFRVRKLSANASFSLGDPAKTGQALGVASMMPFMYSYDIAIEPDFQSDDAYVHGDISLAGWVRCIHIVVSLVRLVCSSEVRSLIKKLEAMRG